MTYLKKYPLDRLKIDKSFVCDLQANTDDAAIVRSTISLGKQLGLSVIAEGIEDRATAELLRSMGCEEGQGYYFGRPMPAAEFEQAFLSKGYSCEPRSHRNGTGRCCGLGRRRDIRRCPAFAGAAVFCLRRLSMALPENRFPLFRIML